MNIQGMAPACETGKHLMRRVYLGLKPVKHSVSPWGDERDAVVPGLQQRWWARHLVPALLPPATPAGVVVSSFVSLVDDGFARSHLSSICFKVMHLKHRARLGLCVQRAGICADMSIYSCYIHLSSCLTCRSLWINFHVSLFIWVLLHPQPPPATCGAEDGRYLTQQCCINDLEKEDLLSFIA